MYGGRFVGSALGLRVEQSWVEGMKSDEMETLKILGAVNVDVDAPRGVIRWIQWLKPKAAE